MLATKLSTFSECRIFDSAERTRFSDTYGVGHMITQGRDSAVSIRSQIHMSF